MTFSHSAQPAQMSHFCPAESSKSSSRVFHSEQIAHIFRPSGAVVRSCHGLHIPPDRRAGRPL